MRKIAGLLLLCLACAVALVGQSPDEAKDAVRVKAACEGMAAANNMADTKMVERLYADDAVWLPPSGPEVTGKAAILASYKGSFKSFTLRLKAETSETQVSGNWAFARGFMRGERVPKAGGAPVPVNDKFLMVLHKGLDGMWKISRLMWNPA